MKNKLTGTVIILIIICITRSATAQWIINPTTGNFFTQTDANSNIESVGIGDFVTAGLNPDAALHINTNFFSLPNAISYNPVSFGEVFRTDAPDRQDDGDIYSFWRMFTGGPGLEVEHLAIFNSDSWNILPSPYNDMNFRATSGNMFLCVQSVVEITFEIS